MPRMIFLASLVAAVVGGTATHAADAGSAMTSASNFAATLAKARAAIESKKLTVFAEIDHSRAAEKAGLSLPPTTLLIFGNPKGGTPLMACDQAIGIDLPLKALIWQDAAGVVRIKFSDPASIAASHGLGDCAKAAVDAMSKAVKSIAAEAVAG
ncbi:DUF302 domain-containing protein [Methylopila sp. M107]|uniref:DUF302 domain-containing protein n=1 Tax=Methylopila sp. M107 TaxID=1101190 RepID=UPI00036094C7|nr:DUF302 domain-containing protein [Methylopila sp. M107]